VKPRDFLLIGAACLLLCRSVQRRINRRGNNKIDQLPNQKPAITPLTPKPEPVFEADRRVKSIRSHPYFARVVWVLSVLGVIWFWIRPAPPGVAAIVLGGGTVLLQTIFGEMRETGKLLFVFFILGLMSDELRSINKQATDQQFDQKRRESAFATIISKNQEVFNTVTGGDSFAYIVPSVRATEIVANGNHTQCILLAAWNSGDYPLGAITFSINERTGIHLLKETHHESIASLPPRWFQPLQSILIPDNTGAVSQYEIFVYSGNGFFVEHLELKNEGGEWRRQYWVTKEVHISDNTTQGITIKRVLWGD